MNKKGFTLIELLGVIVILALIALLTTTSISKVLTDAKDELSDIQKEAIIKAAKAWGAENLNRLPEPENCIYITLQDLKKAGLIDSSVIDPKTKSEVSNYLMIEIHAKLNEYEKTVYSYEILDENVTTSCDYIN